MITVNQIDTAPIAPHARLDSWNERIGQIYAGISIDSKEFDFRYRALHTKLGRLGLARVFSGETEINRAPPSFFAETEEDYLKLHFQNGGSSINHQHGRQAHLKAGEITILDNKTAYSISTSNRCDVYALSIPLSIVHKSLPCADSKVMQVFNGYSLQGRMLFNMLHTIYNECLDQNPKVQNTRAMESANINKPELTTEFLAAEAGLSERRVQTAFSKIDTTPTIYIRSQRLLRASELLQFEPHLAITQVAYRTGFNDSAYFTRCFKLHFSETPKSFRSRYSRP